MGKLWAILDVFRKGSSVSDPKLWKNSGGAVIAVTALLLALSKAARSFGYDDILLSEADAGAIATGIVTAVGLFITFATSDKVGLSAKPKVPPDSLSTPEPNAGQPVDWKSIAERDFNAERGS